MATINFANDQNTVCRVILGSIDTLKIKILIIDNT